MKILFYILTCLLAFTTVSVVAAEDSSAASTKDIMQITRDAGYDVSDINRPKSSIVVDGSTGNILWEDNIDEVRDPASMSKMFTLYLLFEEMAKGKITLDTTITATETDQAISRIYEISNNNIVAGVAYPIRDLITMTIVPSSNAATIMIANYLSNNNASDFIDTINKTAKSLGMTNTYFSNASGAVAEAFQGYYNPERYDLSATNKTTARDLGILIYNFMQKYPNIVNFANQSEVSVMVGTPYEETFHSYNHSLPGGAYPLEGVDGLKTGSSPSAAFNSIVTAKRGDTRLISVVMGVGDWSDQNGEYYRHPFVNALLEKGFADVQEINKSSQKDSKVETVAPRSITKTVKETEKKTFFETVETFINQHSHLLIGLIGFLIALLFILLLITFRQSRP